MEGSESLGIEISLLSRFYREIYLTLNTNTVMPYILIEKESRHGITGIAILDAEIEFITTQDIAHKLLHTSRALSELTAYALQIGKKRQKLGADSGEARRERLKRCCPHVEQCSRSFFSWIVDKELIEQDSYN